MVAVLRGFPERLKLTVHQETLLLELDGLLEQLRPPQVVHDDVTIRLHRPDGERHLTITLPHHTERDFAIELDAAPRQIVIGYGTAREMLYPFDSYRVPGVPWTAVALAIVEDVLRGNREVHTTYWGKRIARVDVYRLEEDAKRLLFSERHVTRVRGWRPFLNKMTEVRRVSYLDPLPAL